MPATAGQDVDYKHLNKFLMPNKQRSHDTFGVPWLRVKIINRGETYGGLNNVGRFNFAFFGHGRLCFDVGFFESEIVSAVENLKI